MSFSPSSTTRTGSLSGVGSSEASRAGTQSSRINCPIGVPGPTRQTVSLSILLSIRGVSFQVRRSFLACRKRVHVLATHLVPRGLAPVGDQCVEIRQGSPPEDDVLHARVQ